MTIVIISALAASMVFLSIVAGHSIKKAEKEKLQEINEFKLLDSGDHGSPE